jgi:hypothetical protein
MAIGQLLLGFFSQKILELGLLCFAGYWDKTVYETITLVNSQPVFTYEIVLLSCLQVMNDNVLQVPRRLASKARVVMPHFDIRQIAQRPLFSKSSINLSILLPKVFTYCSRA